MIKCHFLLYIMSLMMTLLSFRSLSGSRHCRDAGYWTFCQWNANRIQTRFVYAAYLFGTNSGPASACMCEPPVLQFFCHCCHTQETRKLDIVVIIETDHKIVMCIATLPVSAAFPSIHSSTRSLEQLRLCHSSLQCWHRLLVMMCNQSDSAVSRTMSKTTEWRLQTGKGGKVAHFEMTLTLWD